LTSPVYPATSDQHLVNPDFMIMRLVFMHVVPQSVAGSALNYNTKQNRCKWARKEGKDDNDGDNQIHIEVHVPPLDGNAASIYLWWVNDIYMTKQLGDVDVWIDTYY